jgi:hypothetical protein
METMAILRLVFGLILILLGSSCATQPPHPYATNDFVILLAPPPNSKTEGEKTKLDIKFVIPGGTKEYYSVGPDPGRIWVYLDEDTAVYNQQNVRYQAIDLHGSATKQTSRNCFNTFLYPTCKARKNVLYLTAREDDNDSRSLELYFKHPSDFKPAFLDVTVFWENVVSSSSSSYYSPHNLPYERDTEQRTFKFKINAPFGWPPEIATPSSVGGVVLRGLQPG